MGTMLCVPLQRWRLCCMLTFGSIVRENQNVAHVVIASKLSYLRFVQFKVCTAHFSGVSILVHVCIIIGPTQQYYISSFFGRRLIIRIGVAG